jgi:hypothetical protein
MDRRPERRPWQSKEGGFGLRGGFGRPSLLQGRRLRLAARWHAFYLKATQVTPDIEKRVHGDTATCHEAFLELVVAPASQAGKFEARLTGRTLCVSTTPFVDSARVLLAEGVNPAAVLTMRHEGSDTFALRSRLGSAAGLTVQESTGSPRFATWRPYVRAPLPLAA